MFEIAPFLFGRFIVPWYRFRRGAQDVRKEADRSRARYRSGEGITGRAWANAAREIEVQLLPAFASQQEMRAFYIDHLGVPQQAAEAVSDYMTGVRGIISYSFVGENDLFLGLLSLDIREAELKAGEGQTIAIVPENGEQCVVDADQLYLLLRAVGNVLDSFKERRPPYE